MNLLSNNIQIAEQSSNIVSNNSFEDNILVNNKNKYYFWGIKVLKNWNRFLPDSFMTAQYFNYCNNCVNKFDIYKVRPSNSVSTDPYLSDTRISNYIYGNQLPFSGKSYIGVSFFSKPDYIVSCLEKKIESNHTYKVSLMISMAECSQLAIDKIPVTFSNTLDPSDDVNSQTIFLKSNNGKILDDTIQWTEVSSTCELNKNYKYFSIGTSISIRNNQINYKKTGFKSVPYLEIKDKNIYKNFIYYFIDDVKINDIEDKESDVTLNDSLNNMYFNLLNEKVVWLDNFKFLDENEKYETDLGSKFVKLVDSLRDKYLNNPDTIFSPSSNVWKLINNYPGYYINYKNTGKYFLSNQPLLTVNAKNQLDTLINLLISNYRINIFINCRVTARITEIDLFRRECFSRLKFLKKYLEDHGISENRITFSDSYTTILSGSRDNSGLDYNYYSLNRFYVVTVSTTNNEHLYY
jgi:hypothetical protein